MVFIPSAQQQLDTLLPVLESLNMNANGRNYMQLPTAGGFPVEPHRRYCGLHGLLSARKRQLTYSFCYRFVVYFFRITFFLQILANGIFILLTKFLCKLEYSQKQIISCFINRKFVILCHF